MARRQKRTVDYFPYYVTGSKKTISILENRFGIHGHYFWFHLLEILATTDGHAYDYNSPFNKEHLISFTKCGSEEVADTVLNLLAKLEAIDPDLWEQGIIWSQNFVDGVKDAYKKRVDQLPQKPDFSRRNPIKNDQSDPEILNNEQSGSGNGESKVKESKVKESKVNNNARTREVKINYAPNVKITQTEYENLVNEHGEEFAKKCIQKLDNYIPNKQGKPYKDHYRAILSWVVGQVLKEEGQSYNSRAAPKSLEAVKNVARKRGVIND